MRRIRKLAESRRICLGRWNILRTWRDVDTAVRRDVDILCVQEIKWRGQKAKEVGDTDFKVLYMGTVANRNGVGI